MVSCGVIPGACGECVRHTEAFPGGRRSHDRAVLLAPSPLAHAEYAV